MEGILLVDGYNVMNAWPDYQDLMAVDLEHARDRLASDLSEFRALSGCQVILVFDAHHVKGGGEHREAQTGIEIVYTREGETADQWIERYAALYRFSSQSNKLPLYVITFDWMEQRIVAAQGAYRITPEELRQELLRLRKAEKDVTERGPDRVSLDSRLSERVKSLLEGWRRRKTGDE